MSVPLKDEVRGAAFGDQRLTKRLGRIVEELGAKPTMSVPAATRNAGLRQHRVNDDHGAILACRKALGQDARV